MNKYTNENGDTVEARGLTLTVEFGEKTKNELLDRAASQMREAIETMNRLTKALADTSAENAKLRRFAKLDENTISVLNNCVDDLSVENEKLRELVRVMHGELVSCEDNGYVCGGHKFDDRVRELGVEVEQ